MLRKLLVSLLVFAMIASFAFAQTKKKMNPLEEIFGGLKNNGLSNEKIVFGLKEALNIGTGNAVTGVGRLEGFSRTRSSKF